MNKKAPNEAFCIAPWTHTFISPQSERRLCCASREEHNFARQYLDSNFDDNNEDANSVYKPVSLDEYWNSKLVRGIRLKMLRGEIPEECSVCHEKELTLSIYKDYFTKELFPDLVQEAIDNTDETGKTSMKPRSFDYRFNNKCNFSCRMCGEQLSSKWEKEKIDNNLWSKETDPWLVPEFKKKIKLFQESVVEKEFFDAIKNGEVEEIYWVGGEPLLWDIHWETMKYLVDNATAKNTIVRYNTNLSILKYKNINILDDFFPHFKKVLLQASIDGTGKVVEYIRTGLNWERWLENLKKAKACQENNKNVEVSMDLTITLPGLFTLKDMIDLSCELDIPIVPNLVFAFDPTIVLSPLALPRNILHEFLNEIIKHNFINLNKNTKALFDTLMDLRTRLTHEEKYQDNWEKGFYTGREKQLLTERIRKDKYTLADIYKERPDIYEWWIRK